MSKDEFINQLEIIGIKPTESQIKLLDEYYDLIIEYNKIMNLTGITKKEDVYLKHFYDSLTIAKVISLNEEQNLCDLGSGAGFPGIVLKIFYPNLDIVLVDSLTKRINFLNIVIEKLKLKNIKTINMRIEDFARINKEKFDVVTARAVAPTNILLELGTNLIKVNKYFIAMKGNIENEPNYENAINKLNLILIEKLEFKLPIENSNRCLLLFQKRNITSNIYPRKYSEIKKKPL